MMRDGNSDHDSACSPTLVYFLLLLICILLSSIAVLIAVLIFVYLLIITSITNCKGLDYSALHGVEL